MDFDLWANDGAGVAGLCEIHIWCNSMDRSKIARCVRLDAELGSADAAGLMGVTSKRLESWESGAVRPRTATLMRMATAYEVKLLPLLMFLTQECDEAEWAEDRDPPVDGSD